MPRGRPTYAPRKRDSRGRFRTKTPSRSSTPKPVRAKSAPARARSAPAKLGRKAVQPKTQGSQLGYKSSTLSLAKPMSRSKMTSKLVASMLEPVILRWNGVKAFTGNGNYWMENRLSAVGVRSLPFYMMDLTAVNQQTVGAAQYSYPFVQLAQATATGNMYFLSKAGLAADGTTATSSFLEERSPYTTSGTGTPNTFTAPFGKSIISHASIQANLWGATAKATKYMVQIVRIGDEDLVPDHNLAYSGTEVTKASAKRNDFYQNLIKPWTFNPISTTGGIAARSYKVLKTQTITIEPNPTTDGDADPQCVVYKAFLKLNKVMRYQETANYLVTEVRTNDQADYAVNSGYQITTQAEQKARVYLVIRATNYGRDSSDINSSTVTPSFDLSVRVKHTIAK